MRKTYLFAGLAIAAISMGAAGTASAAQPAGVTCPVGANGIQYHYVARHNTCVPVKVSARMATQSTTTPQALKTSTIVVQAPANTLASGDGS
ncbi:MAG TPA: hypothetical protein VL418_13830 [Devosiaceae bacterium]|nr:hypothetical protein [Devosiaceae bacterium]